MPMPDARADADAAHPPSGDFITTNGVRMRVRALLADLRLLLLDLDLLDLLLFLRRSLLMLSASFLLQQQ